MLLPVPVPVANGYGKYGTAMLFFIIFVLQKYLDRVSHSVKTLFFNVALCTIK